MNILYSFNKVGWEAVYWEAEIAAASSERFRFVPFNHEPYLDPNKYTRAQLLDNLYYLRDPGLMRLYADFQQALKDNEASAIIVDNCFPYHPEFLRTLRVYKVLRTSDGPLRAYDRDFAYVHAYDHVLYHSPAYSRDLSMADKLRYCGAKVSDFWPHALFDAVFDKTKTERDIVAGVRDIDIIFVGAMFPNKMPLLAMLKKEFGSRFRLHGLTSWKRNIYFNLRYRCAKWVRPIRFREYIPLYQRSKIGVNIHNRGAYTVGSYRLFELAGNGVMQISDGGDWLNSFFEVGNEVIGYSEADELIEKIWYYLAHEEERKRIALNAFSRVLRDHRFSHRMQQAAELIAQGIKSAEAARSIR